MEYSETDIKPDGFLEAVAKTDRSNGTSDRCSSARFQPGRVDNLQKCIE